MYQITDCKYCGRSLASSKPYVQFNKNAALDKAREQNAFLPKYEAKLGIDCDKCGKFQKWLTQEEYTMLGSRFVYGEKEMDSDGFATKMTDNATLLRVRAKTNCPMGGDAGHGGRTTIEFINEGSACMEVNGERTGKISISFLGDWEYYACIAGLEFALANLKKQHSSK